MSRLQSIKGFTISRDAYFVVAAVALGSLALIVLTGAAVRLTASGLGCPDWPKCYGGTVPPADLNAVIEYGNRLITGFVGLMVIAACALAFGVGRQAGFRAAGTGCDGRSSPRPAPRTGVSRQR